MRLARGIAALCAVIVAATAVIVVAHRGAVAVQPLIAIALASVAAGVGVVLSIRLPRHPAGPLNAAAGALAAVTVLPGELAGAPLAGDWMLLYAPFALLLLVMPEGVPRGAIRRGLMLGIPLVAVVFLPVAEAAEAAPGGAAEIVGLALVALFATGLAAALVETIARYRGADERTRVQLRWVLLAGFSVPATLLLCWASMLLLGSVDLVVVGLAVMYLSLPLASAAALLAPGRVDVDRLLVAVASGAVLATAALLLITGGMLASRALPGEPTSAAGIAMTALVTLGAVAAYRGVRHAVGHVLYRDRERASSAIRLLRQDVDAGTAHPEDVQRVLRASLGDPGLVVTYRRITGGVVAIDGTPAAPEAGGCAAIPVTARGEQIGALVSSPGRVKPPPVQIARLAAPLVDAVRMRAGLAEALREVGASRERLLRAGYEERRRLERDLHDGAQQRLVALGMALRVLQRSRPQDASLAAELDAAVAEVALAVAELRRLAHGVRPSTLDDGLRPALADLVRRSPVPIELDIADAELPDAVTTTAYFVASEAIVNAIRHADAGSIRVRLSREDDRVRLRVSDDGCGGASARSGLAGLCDRVEAIGGRLRIDSPPGLGTTVEAVIPCGS